MGCAPLFEKFLQGNFSNKKRKACFSSSVNFVDGKPPKLPLGGNSARKARNRKQVAPLITAATRQSFPPGGRLHQRQLFKNLNSLQQSVMKRAMPAHGGKPITKAEILNLCDLQFDYCFLPENLRLKIFQPPFAPLCAFCAFAPLVFVPVDCISSSSAYLSAFPDTAVDE